MSTRPQGNINTKKCVGCAKDIVSSDQIKCSKCCSRFHFDCVNTSNRKFKELSSDYKNTWLCPTCRSKQPKSDNTNTPVRCLTSTSENISPTSNVTIRRAPPSQQSNYPDTPPTIYDIKQVIQDEMKTFGIQMEQKFTQIVNTKIKEMIKEINEIKYSISFLNEQYEDFKREIQVKFEDIKDVKHNNERLNNQIRDLNNRLSIMEQHARMSNLEIQCVPEHKNENLPSVITQIAKTTGNNVIDSDIHKCTRIAKLNPESKRPRSIVVKFASPRIRDHFLAGVIKFNKTNKDDKLNTSHIGIGGQKDPIYVVDHLTAEIKKLHAAARETSKRLNYKFVWVKNGRVFLRKDEGANHIIVRNMDQLAELT